MNDEYRVYRAERRRVARSGGRGGDNGVLQSGSSKVVIIFQSDELRQVDKSSLHRSNLFYLRKLLCLRVPVHAGLEARTLRRTLDRVPCPALIAHMEHDQVGLGRPRTRTHLLGLLRRRKRKPEATLLPAVS